jgi:hypothetical protein
MHRLSYHSHALAASPAVLDAIYAEAAAFNASAGITGALVYLDGRWAQILEGHSAAITGLYHRIARDPRDSEVLVSQDAAAGGSARACTWGGSRGWARRSSSPTSGGAQRSLLKSP